MQAKQLATRREKEEVAGCFWTTLKHKLGGKHQSRWYLVYGQCEMRHQTVEDEARGENLQNTIGSNKTPKRGFNLVYSSAHPSVWGQICCSKSMFSSAARPLSLRGRASRCSPLRLADLAVSQQAAARCGPW